MFDQENLRPGVYIKKKSSKYKLLTHKARDVSKSTYLATNSLPTAIYNYYGDLYDYLHCAKLYRKSDVNYNGVYKVSFN